MLVDFGNKTPPPIPNTSEKLSPVPDKIPQPPKPVIKPPVTKPALTPNVTPPKNKYSAWFSKIRKVKNFEIYLAVVLILVMVAIYMTTLGGGTPRNNTQNGWQHNSTQAFARDMEARLVQTLSGIRGAGNVRAMVTVVGSATLEIAYNIDERTVTQSGAGGTSTTNTTIIRTPVIIHGRDGPQPLILFEIKPQIRGVVIVATGAGDPSVRMQLLRAVQAIIADDTVRIEIFTGT